MNGLEIGLGATIVGILAHAVVLRHLPKRWRLLALPLLLLTAYAAFVLLAVTPGDSGRWVEAFVALTLTLSLGFAYALMLIGVLYDSPTLALVKRIESYGTAGMPVGAFEQFVADHPFVQSRLDALMAAGEIRLEGGEMRLTGKATHLLRIADMYRTLRGGTSQSG